MIDFVTAGAVLTGGASRRMGTNKATLLVEGTPLAVRVATVLVGAGCAPVWFQGGNLDQLGVDELGVDELGVLKSAGEVLADAVPGRGPVGAIASALESVQRLGGGVDGVLIAACDLIDLDVDTVRSVIDAGSEGTVSVACEPVDSARGISDGSRDRRWHLLSWWSVTLAEPVAKAVAAGVTSYHALLRELGQQRAGAGGVIHAGETVTSVVVPPGAVRNVNRPSDLARG